MLMGTLIYYLYRKIIIVNENSARASDLGTSFYTDEQLKQALQAVRLVVIDIDGTLLTDPDQNSNGNLTARTINTLQQLKRVRSDITIMLATGRCFYASHHIAKTLHLQGVNIICSNGAIVSSLNTFNPLFVNAHSVATAQAILDYGVVEQINTIATIGDGSICYVNAIEPQFPSHKRWLEEYNCRFVAISNEAIVVQCSMWVPYAQVATVLDHLKTNFATRCYLYYHDTFAYVEISPLNVNKWDGIEKMKSLLHLTSNEQIMTIGNGDNDMQMLETAGIGVAMGNAPVEVKACANYVIGNNNDDAVAKFLARCFLL